MSRVRVGIIDSGVHDEHPHIGNIKGGVQIREGRLSEDYSDRLGHGTAVAAAIHEKAPEADLFAIKVFDRSLTTNVETLVRAIEWCIEHEMDVVNMSLGTPDPSHATDFLEPMANADAARTLIIAARWARGHKSLPGSLPGVIGVEADEKCPRDTCRWEMHDGRPIFYASPYPRPIPGVPPERNLNGISFAVANVTGLVVRLHEDYPRPSSQTEVRGIEPPLPRFALDLRLRS